MSKIIELAGVTFELYQSKNHPVAPITGYVYDEIYEVYGRPSQTKVKIWHDWCAWVDDMRKEGYECGIEICSRNSFSFSISGSVRKDGHTYDIYITEMHNRCYQYD